MIRNIGFSDRGRTDIRIAGLSTRLQGGADPTLSQVWTNGAGSAGIYMYEFAKDATNNIFFEIQLPHEWKSGTTVYPHVHWLPKTLGAAGKLVQWGLEYMLIPFGGVAAANSTIITGKTHMPTDTTLDALRHYVTSIGSGINMSAITDTSPMFMCRLFRDGTAGAGNDDYDDTCYLMEFDLHIETWRLGDRVTTW